MFEDNRCRVLLEIDGEVDGCEITINKMENAIKKMPAEKATRQNGIAVEMLKVLGDKEKTILLKLFNNILKTGKMPKDFLKLKFVVIPKKSKATKCSDCKTISLVYHGIKLFLKIILNRMMKAIDREVGKLQFGYREKTETREVIFVLRILIEKSIQVQKDVYLALLITKRLFTRYNMKISLKHLANID